MKHKGACVIMLLTIVLPTHGGQPTRHTRGHHMRKNSISTADLSTKYTLETEESSSDTAQPKGTFSLDFGWPLATLRSANNFTAIQKEIASEVARRSPEERIRYLRSIISLTDAYPEWLDALHQEEDTQEWFDESI